MTLTTESCVAFALAELQRAEAVRQADEARREAQHRLEMAEREQRERSAAEAHARLQAEIELRELAARERVTAMQQALRELKAERDALRDDLVLQRASTASAGPAAIRCLCLCLWMIGGLLLGLVAMAAIAALLLSRSR
jgi:hypothetical protein